MTEEEEEAVVEEEEEEEAEVVGEEGRGAHQNNVRLKFPLHYRSLTYLLPRLSSAARSGASSRGTSYYYEYIYKYTKILL